MTVPRAQTPVWALMASAALFSLPSAAQPGPAPANEVEREIAISGAAGELPAIVYGAPDWPVMVSFDAPLKTGAAMTVQGADVRPHPFRPDTLVITPSRFLTAQSSLPVLVPLADGAIALTLAFSPPRRDASVRIVHRDSSAQSGMTKAEQQEALSFAAKSVLAGCESAQADATAVPRQVQQRQNSRTPRTTVVYGGGVLTYMRVKASATCAPAAARLTRGEESAEVLLFQAQTNASCGAEICWLLVARPPQGDGGGFTLELLAKDGVPCQSSPVDLKPPSP